MVVSGGKCNNGIKRGNSTGSLSIINRAYLIYEVQNKKVYPSKVWQNLNLNFLKVCRIKSLKVYFIFLSFQNLKKKNEKRLHDRKTFWQWEEEKRGKRKKEEKKIKDKKKID